MGVESADDLAVFLSPSDFGKTATVTPAAAGLPFCVDGLFSEPTVPLGISGLSLNATAPTFKVSKADAAKLRVDDFLEFEGEKIQPGRVKAIEPEGDGELVVVTLKR